MRARTLIVRNPHGLHARPAGVFVQAALAHGAAVRLRKGDRVANGKSVLAVLTLGLKCADQVTLEIDDDDEPALARLAEILGAEIIDIVRPPPESD
jgi:phosphocarrier protein HPr